MLIFRFHQINILWKGWRLQAEENYVQTFYIVSHLYDI